MVFKILCILAQAIYTEHITLFIILLYGRYFLIITCVMGIQFQKNNENLYICKHDSLAVLFMTAKYQNLQEKLCTDSIPPN